MRAWEPIEGESHKAFEGYKAYRDLPVQFRSVDRAWEVYSGRQLGGKRAPGHFQRWARLHDWVERVAAHDARDEMIARTALKEFQSGKAAAFAEKQIALKEALLNNAMEAADQAAKMLMWPLTEQKVISEDGRDVYVFVPARWTKNTAVYLHQMATSAITGAWMTVTLEGNADEEQLDFSGLTDSDLRTYIELTEKLARSRKQQGE